MGGRRCFPRFARRKGSLEPGGAGYRSRLLLQRATCHHSTGRSSLDCHCRHHLYEQLDGSLQPPECRYRRHERGFGNGWHKILRCCFGLFHHIHYLSASSYYLDSQNRSTHFPLRHLSGLGCCYGRLFLCYEMVGTRTSTPCSWSLRSGILPRRCISHLNMVLPLRHAETLCRLLCTWARGLRMLGYSGLRLNAAGRERRTRRLEVDLPRLRSLDGRCRLSWCCLPRRFS